MTQHQENTSDPHGAPHAPGGEEHWQHEQDNVDVGLVGAVGVFGVVTLVLILVLMQAWYYSAQQHATDSRAVAAEDPQTALGALRTEQVERLGRYRWINREAGVRAIPIGRAMQVIVDEANAPAPPTPSPVPAAAPASAPPKPSASR